MDRKTCPHPWIVTAPWYDWAHPGVPSSGRGSRPSIQKFASDDFIADFIREPQHSLQFHEHDDQIFTAQLVSAQPGGLSGKLAALFALRPDGRPLGKGDDRASALKTRLVGSGLRKLYLPSHARHYLLVCELHCDAPGLPPPAPDSVCQAGFVVRRMRMGYAPEFRAEALGLLREVVQAQVRLSDLDQATPLRRGLLAARSSRLLRLQRQGRFEDERAAAAAALDAARARLESWQTERGVRAFKEGWFPLAHEGIGEWRELADETPDGQVEERWIRLFPLAADPRNPRHSARGRALYYAIVPTAAFESTARGEARFDDQSTYELRCFFRQHRCDCPFEGLNSAPPDCEGPLCWSEASQPYRLAAQFDLLGSSNRPVTIQMPNLADLAAQAAGSPIGRFSPVRFVHPQQLQSKTDGGIPSSGSVGGPAICFFSIPLITIVASFVLNLFLPIVVLLFNLWFLLALRFCIPPSFSIDAGLMTALAAIPPKPDVDAELGVDVDAAGWRLNGEDAATVQPKLVAELAAQLSETTGIPAGKIAGQLGDLGIAPLATLARVQVEKSQQQLHPDGRALSALDPGGRLLFRPLLQSQWKHEKYLPSTGEFS